MTVKNKIDKVGKKIKVGIELDSEMFKANAYEIYKQSRKSNPILFVYKGELGTEWLITRYEDAISLLKDNRLKKDPANVFPQDTLKKFSTTCNDDSLTAHLINSDPPSHKRLRPLVQKSFTPKMVERLKVDIKNTADTLLDKIQSKGTLNLIHDYAYPLSLTVICKILGIPPEGENRFRVWSHAIFNSPTTPEEIQIAESVLTEFLMYAEKLVDIKKKEPKEDLISILIKAKNEEHKLSTSELYAQIMGVISAGHETTVNLIANTILALLENPKQLQLLKEKPELIDSAIEEGLRYYSPVEVTTARWAAESFKIHNQTIQKGDMVTISLASANRDESIFENPEQFDITRKNNPHIAFGHGSHFCLGAQLARMEAKIAISTLLRRMPTIQIKENREKIKWQGSYLMRALEELPLIF